MSAFTSGQAPLRIVGGLALTRGAQVGSVPLLRGPLLHEGCAATRWQWYHPKCKTQDMYEGLRIYAPAPEKRAEVQRFRDHSTDS